MFPNSIQQWLHRIIHTIACHQFLEKCLCQRRNHIEMSFFYYFCVFSHIQLYRYCTVNIIQICISGSLCTPHYQKMFRIVQSLFSLPYFPAQASLGFAVIDLYNKFLSEFFSVYNKEAKSVPSFLPIKLSFYYIKKYSISQSIFCFSATVFGLNVYKLKNLFHF